MNTIWTPHLCLSMPVLLYLSPIPVLIRHFLKNDIVTMPACTLLHTEADPVDHSLVFIINDELGRNDGLEDPQTLVSSSFEEL